MTSSLPGGPTSLEQCTCSVNPTYDGQMRHFVDRLGVCMIFEQLRWSLLQNCRLEIRAQYEAGRCPFTMRCRHGTARTLRCASIPGVNARWDRAQLKRRYGIGEQQGEQSRRLLQEMHRPQHERARDETRQTKTMWNCCETIHTICLRPLGPSRTPTHCVSIPPTPFLSPRNQNTPRSRFLKPPADTRPSPVVVR